MAEDGEKTAVQSFFFPDKEDLPEDFEMPIWDHLEELRERVMVAALACGGMHSWPLHVLQILRLPMFFSFKPFTTQFPTLCTIVSSFIPMRKPKNDPPHNTVAILTCFAFSKDLVLFLEAPVATQGVRFLQLSPGEFFFTTLKVSGYTGLLLSAPTVLYEIASYVIPGLTKDERQFLGPVILGSTVLFLAGLFFSYEILTPAALSFFVSFADGAVESLWSIDQYFEFVLVLMLSTGLSFQVPVVQVMLGQLGIVTSEQMFSQWRYVVVGATAAAAVLTPSTDPFTQMLLAGPLVGLYMGGASAVRFLESKKVQAA